MDQIYSFLETTGPVFCLDIGSGTQDGLLALPDERYDNWPRFVLPSPAQHVKKSIETATERGVPIWLYGENMGGGFSPALKKHIETGLPVYATQSAALAVHDNPDRVRAMGITIQEETPKNCQPVYLSDYSQSFWRSFWLSMGLEEPRLTVIAAQDHGFSLTGNRANQMLMWRDLLVRSSIPSEWFYNTVPGPLTRLATLKKQSGAYVCDTGTSALLAFFCDSGILNRSYREGVTLVNVGNTHVLAALVFKQRVCGLYEQHTDLLSEEKLLADLTEFRLGWLPTEQVQAESGHGTVYGNRPPEAGGFEPTYCTGPKRERFPNLGRFVNPCGDMMTAGCFGLINGLASYFSSTKHEGSDHGRI